MPRDPSTEVLQVREQILATALELFAQQGVAGVSLRQIADAVELHNSTLLHYFESKRELAIRVFEAVAERHRELFEPLAARPAPDREAGIEILCRALDHLRAQPHEARILLRAVADLEPTLKKAGEPAEGCGEITAPLRDLLTPWVAKQSGVRARRGAWSTTAWQLLSLVVATALTPGSESGERGKDGLRASARALLAHGA